jgi:Domain of unknown function (DUF4376)
MSEYKLNGNGVTRTRDGANIPIDTGNRDWIEYSAWVSKGNTPDAERTLPEAKTVRGQRITQARNGALSSLTAEFDGDIWDADEATSARIANALTMIEQAGALGIPTPTEIAWRTADNKDRTLTIAELVQMGASVFLAQQQVWGKQAALKNQIAAATNQAQVEAVSW